MRCTMFPTCVEIFFANVAVSDILCSEEKVYTTISGLSSIAFFCWQADDAPTLNAGVFAL